MMAMHSDLAIGHHIGILCTLDGLRGVVCNGTHYSLPEPALNTGDLEFWLYIGVYCVLVLCAGMCSGLTLGLLSLDVMQLTVLMEAGTRKERRYAAKILPVVRRHHLLLVTLLLANAGCVEAMPIFLDRVSDPVTSILISVTAVLLFGEVFPQALCSRYGLAIGAYLTPVVYFLMFVLFIISWPLSKLLDCLLGETHSTFFRRGELKALVGLHGPGSNHKRLDTESPLTIDEVLIIKGALEMRDKCVGDAMVSLNKVFMLEKSAVLNQETMDLLLKECHSRVPVFDNSRQNVIGVLLVKRLITLDPEDAIPMTKLLGDPLCCCPVSNVPESMALFDLLNQFQTGKSHLAVVRKSIDILSIDSMFDDTIREEVIGIITLEDVIEELLQEEIFDEKDVYTEVERTVLQAKEHLQSYSRAQSLADSIKIKKYKPVISRQASASSIHARSLAGSRQELHGGAASGYDTDAETGARTPLLANGHHQDPGTHYTDA